MEQDTFVQELQVDPLPFVREVRARLSRLALSPEDLAAYLTSTDLYCMALRCISGCWKKTRNGLLLLR